MKLVPLEPVDPCAICDSQYRQGYHQGYCQALEDLLRLDRATLVSFADGRLQPWRRDGAGTPPPKAPQ